MARFLTWNRLIAKLLSTFYWPFIETYNGELNPTIIRDSVGGLTRYISRVIANSSLVLMINWQIQCHRWNWWCNHASFNSVGASCSFDFGCIDLCHFCVDCATRHAEQNPAKYNGRRRRHGGQVVRFYKQATEKTIFESNWNEPSKYRYRM